tara:strand:- start:307 stop:2235 length:1929 start_codon:yes stop_codon:yes gene_type:complete
MATNDKRLRVTELDFDNIKENLKVFLKAQTEFKDYDFEGSGMNILLDTLAYNTHYLGFNANMLANEMFLDSASLRSSVVSHAKSLGYEVSSSRAPVATINVSLSTDANTKTMSAGTAFTTSIDGVDYQFVTIADVTSSNTGSAVPFDSVKIYEGTYITSTATVDSSEVDQRFLLNDARADTSTLTVKVQNSSSDTTTTTYTKATDITQLSSSSTVYYLQETDSGLFEVYFGDGVVSKGLSDGNIVTLQYVVTNRTLANGASSFSSPSSIDGVTGITVTTVANATGGSNPETVESIKLNAPLDYASQGRAVTIDDYKTYTKKLFPNTQAVSVWGGEDGSYDTSTGVSSNPEYGKVFISIKSTTGENLTTVQKSNLVTAFAPYKVASVTPVIVDPETIFLILNVSFQYDSTATTSTKDELASLIATTISNYNSSDLQEFNSSFRHSKLLRLIDDTDTAILNNTTTVTMGKFFTPVNASSSYNINFNNAFFNPHSGHNAEAGGIIASTGFQLDNDTTTEYFFDDDGSGNLRIYSLSSGVRTYLNSAAGTIDYTNGTISTTSLFISAVSNVDGESSTQIRVTAIPKSNDVVPVRNQILEIDLVNTTTGGNVDAQATTGVGYTVSATGTTSTTTVSTPSSTPTSSAY